MESNEKELELIRMSRQGDREAFGRLVEEHQSVAMAVAFSCTGDANDAMDVVQEAFVAAYCRLGQLRDGGSFGPWLRTIIRNTAISEMRRPSRRQEKSVESVDDQSSPDRRRKSGCDNADLWEAIGVLPEKFREPVILHYFQHWPYRRIADFMGLPEATVKGRLQQARQRLRTFLTTTRKAPAMNDKQVVANVQKAVQKIATADIHQVIPLQGAKNLVIFASLRCDIELCHTDGQDVVINGTKASIGLTPEQATESVNAIHLLTDRVADYVSSGPHDGELFTGTALDKDGKCVALKRQICEYWNKDGRGSLGGVATVAPGTASQYDGLTKPSHDIEPIIRRHMTDVLRLSILRDKVEDVVLPSDLVTEELQRLILVNYDDEKVVHGQVGRVSLTVAVPAGCGVTVISQPLGSNILVDSLRSDLALICPWQARVKNVEGNVVIADGLAQEVSGVTGPCFAPGPHARPREQTALA